MSRAQPTDTRKIATDKLDVTVIRYVDGREKRSVIPAVDIADEAIRNDAAGYCEKDGTIHFFNDHSGYRATVFGAHRKDLEHILEVTRLQVANYPVMVRRPDGSKTPPPVMDQQKHIDAWANKIERDLSGPMNLSTHGFRIYREGRTYTARSNRGDVRRALAHIALDGHVAGYEADAAKATRIHETIVLSRQAAALARLALDILNEPGGMTLSKTKRLLARISEAAYCERTANPGAQDTLDFRSVLDSAGDLFRYAYSKTREAEEHPGAIEWKNVQGAAISELAGCEFEFNDMEAEARLFEHALAPRQVEDALSLQKRRFGICRDSWAKRAAEDSPAETARRSRAPRP